MQNSGILSGFAYLCKEAKGPFGGFILSNMNKLFLFDAMALIYRAHFAFSKTPRINSKGLNTGAVLGFTNTLLKIVQEEKPSHLGVAFDTPEPTFRHTQFTEYKAHRQEQPEEITLALPYIYRMVAAFNIPALVRPGYEADDLIGTIAKKAAQTGEFQTFMLTPDKDYAQLVEENIFLYKPDFMGDGYSVWGIPEVLNKFGLQNVMQVVDLLGLQGDAVDNIPGIPGIGPKTAVKLLQEYGSVENILAHSHQLKGKLRERVEQHRDQALLSKQLARIDTEVPIDFEPEALRLVPFDREEVRALFAELEFRTLARKLLGEDAPAASPPASKKSRPGQGDLFAPPPSPPESLPSPEIPVPLSTPKNTLASTLHHYYCIDTPELRQKLVQHLQSQTEFCLDTETDHLDAHLAQLVGIAFSTHPHEAYYVPFPENQAEAQALIEELRPVLENPAITKIGQNLKYDVLVLKNYQLALQGPLFDTMLAHYLIEPDQRHNLDLLAENYLHYTPQSIEELIGKKGAKQGNMRDVPVAEVVEYAGEDADLTLQLKHQLARQLHQLSPSGDLEKVFYTLETPLIPVLAEMEHTGISLDKKVLIEISRELEQDILVLEQNIYEKAGEKFNIGSPKQLGDILFEKLRLDNKAKKTKTGQYATGEEILVKLAPQHPIVAEVLDYRELLKLKNTYVDTLPEMCSPKDGRIHTNYQQAVAATGRLSSANPNLQNIPIRTAKGRLVRKAFVAKDEDHVLLSADYSQIELRIMAAFSQDETMLEAFRQGRDIHATTAAKIFKIAPEAVDSTMRNKAKTANFGIIYGISAFGLAERLNIPRGEAGDFIRAYFEEFPAVKAYMDRVIEEARSREYVETLLGRRRYLRNINSRNQVERGNAERNAINAPIQGSAADMIKLAMIKIHDFIQKEQLESRMLLQVHDELVFEVPKKELDVIRPAIEQLMKNALPLAVPMEVGIGTGANWLEAH
ncbi:MAG: DNA polymerase I [Microscillaceae bacterium]